MTLDIAIITARGGSKRIPGKNLRPFLGRPIIDYSIDAAISSGLFDHVIVSTDSDEIARYALSQGASVPFMRSAANSDDYATTSDVLKEVTTMLSKHGYRYDNFCCIYPTAPFVTASILGKAKKLLVDSGADSVIPIVKFGFPPQRAFVKAGQYIEYEYPHFSQMRSQDLQPIFHDCGQFYYCRADSFAIHGNTVMPKTVGLEIDELFCQDIDNETDWQIAELKYGLAQKSGGFS